MWEDVGNEAMWYIFPTNVVRWWRHWVFPKRPHIFFAMRICSFPKQFKHIFLFIATSSWSLSYRFFGECDRVKSYAVSKSSFFPCRLFKWLSQVPLIEMISFKQGFLVYRMRSFSSAWIQVKRMDIRWDSIRDPDSDCSRQNFCPKPVAGMQAVSSRDTCSLVIFVWFRICDFLSKACRWHAGSELKRRVELSHLRLLQNLRFCLDRRIRTALELLRSQLHSELLQTMSVLALMIRSNGWMQGGYSWCKKRIGLLESRAECEPTRLGAHRRLEPPCLDVNSLTIIGLPDLHPGSFRESAVPWHLFRIDRVLEVWI